MNKWMVFFLGLLASLLISHLLKLNTFEEVILVVSVGILIVVLNHFYIKTKKADRG